MGKVKNEEQIQDIKPIVITDNESGNSYTLEFNRKVITKAEKSGFHFDGESAGQMPMSLITELWYWAFQMHNWGMSKEKTDSILFDVCGGITEDVLTRLLELYTLPYNALIVSSEDASKNSRATIQM